jgi:uncharacterized protein (DUF1778 family)
MGKNQFYYEVHHMYTKDKNNRITLRLNDEQFEFVKANADMLDVSPSEFLRMVVNSTMSLTKKAMQKANERLEVLEEVGRENGKTDFDNLI